MAQQEKMYLSLHVFFFSLSLLYPLPTFLQAIQVDPTDMKKMRPKKTKRSKNREQFQIKPERDFCARSAISFIYSLLLRF
jgi:hypothetical protein